MEYKNNYPVVIVHGLMGWGEQDLIDKKFPHFGLTHEKDLCKHLREQGIEVHRPSLGPVNSGWDRACVLWAYLFGGRVDYGKVHSEKYGHARFGREYPGVLKDLGQDGPHKKINIFGKSHVDEVAQEFGIPVLARLPINPAVAEAFDAGLMETVDTAHLAEAVAAIENA